MVFALIETAPALAPASRRRAARVGPPAVLTRSTYPSMLSNAGFVDIRTDDRTPHYRAMLTAWVEAVAAHADQVREALGPADFDERWQKRLGAIAAVDDDILRRTLYTARVPTPRR